VLEKPGTPFVFYNESRKKGVVPVKKEDKSKKFTFRKEGGLQNEKEIC